uniref:Uncharacterized protein n=1 Tax=Fundulus heteroclitus TaxID=8078 RepID=A0A3Q2R3H6_FUNHE
MLFTDSFLMAVAVIPAWRHGHKPTHRKTNTQQQRAGGNTDPCLQILRLAHEVVQPLASRQDAVHVLGFTIIQYSLLFYLNTALSRNTDLLHGSCCCVLSTAALGVYKEPAVGSLTIPPT